MTDPARKQRKRHDNYRLRVESVTYLGDDKAAARAIENFLKLRRPPERPEQLKPDDRLP